MIGEGKVVRQMRGKEELGWFTASLLFLVLSVPAWGLDIDLEIAKHNSETAQILGTLGRDRRPQQFHRENDGMNVQLIAKKQSASLPARHRSVTK